mgnify:CR=1 FL=1
MHQRPYTAHIKIGEIIKLDRGDKVPYLEVIIEMENDKVLP